MLNYIHEGHLGKEHCLLRAKNTVFWPKITYDIQQLIDKCMICQEYGKSQPIIGATLELPPYPWHTVATDLFYWKRMDFLIVADVFSKYILVRKLPNSTSSTVFRELAMIVTVQNAFCPFSSTNYAQWFFWFLCCLLVFLFLILSSSKCALVWGELL